ncbi:MAG: formyltetrahydrofolate deformylase [Deltaproteobacteria bacterium]|nr:formyltetrahydrofolate deformylase [Deltaproteobacteria bacterium]
MPYRHPSKKVARIRIAGPDRKGIIAAVTGFLSRHNCNIEDIDQRILEGYLIMNMLVDCSGLKSPLPRFTGELARAASSVGCEAEFKTIDDRAVKNVAFLVTKEPHCLNDILSQIKKKKLIGKPAVVIGNHPDLRGLAKKFGVPFFHIPSEKRKEHEGEVLALLKKFDVDLIVLARYMQILSPEFIFRYEGKIINIHPSLLPAFPGPRSYHQAYNKGVEIVGVTAHFVTTDLDEGPIITQESFRVDKTRDTLESYMEKGKKAEAKVLTRAVRLFLENRLVLRRGKVIDNKKMHQLAQTTRQFYQ